MKRITCTLILLISFLALSLTANSCHPDSGNNKNSSDKLIGTKWYNSDGSLGLEFEDNDWAFFYYDSQVAGSGTFVYDASKGRVDFDSFIVIGEIGQEIFAGRTMKIVFTFAVIENGNTMYANFHELDDTEVYHMTLTKR